MLEHEGLLYCIFLTQIDLDYLMLLQHTEMLTNEKKKHMKKEISKER